MEARVWFASRREIVLLSFGNWRIKFGVSNRKRGAGNDGTEAILGEADGW